MAKITIQDEDVTKFKKDPKTLQDVFIYAILAKDVEAIRLLCKHTSIKSHIDKKILFDALSDVIHDDKNLELVESVIEGLKVDLSKQTDPEIGTNLLTKSTCYGSVAIGAFLLNHNFDPNYQDTTGQTTLHYAVTYNRKDFVNLLHNNKVDPCIKNSEGYTALHLTALYKNPDMAKHLKELNASATKIKDNDNHNYEELRKFVIREYDELSPPKLPPIAPLEYFNLYKGVVSFYKAVLSYEKREEYILTAIDSLKEFLNPLTKPPPNVPSDQGQLNLAIEQALRTLVAVYECYKDTNNSTKLKDYIIQKAEHWEVSVVLSMLYNTICVEYLDRADYYNARKYVELAYANIKDCTKAQDNYSQELRHNIFYNLGKVWKYIDREKSIQYFTKAEELMPGNYDTVKELLSYYITCNDSEKSLEQINKIIDSDLKTLYSIIRKFCFQPDDPILNTLKEHAQNTKDEKLKKLYTIMLEFADQSNSTIVELYAKHKFTFPKPEKPEDLKYTLCVETWAEYFSQEHPMKAVSCYEELSTHTEQYIIPTYLFKILEICKCSNSWKEGLDHLTTMYQQHGDILSKHTMLPLKYLEFIFYETNDRQQQSKECWDFLKTHAESGNIASRLFSYAKDFAFYTAIEKNDFTKASSYLSLPNWDIAELTVQFLDTVSLLEEATKEKTKLGLLLEKIKNSTTVQTSSVATEETNFTNEFVAIDLTEDTDKLDSLIGSLTPQAIHAYFQQKKMELLKKPIEVIIKEPSYEWVINNEVYRSDQENVCPVEDKENFYAIINPDLASKLDTNLLAQFSTALSKGLITKMHKSNGIKIIPNKLIALKINDDNRLYTDHIYRNPQGQYLIDFDQHGRHVNSG